MLKEEMQWVENTVRRIVGEEIAKIKFPAPVTPKPVEIDTDGIVKQVLDKIKVVSAEIPKKGKEK